MLPFVGPSYSLQNRKAAVQRTVNMYLAAMETAEKAAFILESVPGLILRASLGAEIRGCIYVDDRLFVIAGVTFYEVASNWAATSRGTLSSATGPVDMVGGLSQVVIVDGANGYVFTLGTNAFATISDPDFYGSSTVEYLDGFFVFIRPDTQQFYISAIDDASTLDALDFASAEGSPDNLVSQVVLHRELWLLGELSTEVWFNAGATFPFVRNNSAILEVGCLAQYSVVKADSSVMWIGRDRNGSGMVYRTSGYQAIRISTQAIEESLSTSTALDEAEAWTYQQHGRTFYCINAPGVDTTWCYEISSGTWHERCELDGLGEFTQGRVSCHVVAFGKHVVGDADGGLYEMDRETYTLAGDALVRERTGPHEATASLDRVTFNQFVLDTTTGETASGDPQVYLSWSNDGGQVFGDPVARSIGEMGEYYPRVIWRRLGQSRDRVWRVRFDADAPFAIVGASA